MVEKTEFKEMQRFIKDLELCMKCGFCAFWCPVYREEQTESDIFRVRDYSTEFICDPAFGHLLEIN